MNVNSESRLQSPPNPGPDTKLLRLETHGVDAVPADERTVGGWYLFQVLVNTLLNPGMMLIAGLAVVSGLSPLLTILGVLLGIVISFTVYVILATIGVDYGLPGIVSTQASLGVIASRLIVSTIRALSAAFWFAVQTAAGAMGIVAVINGLLNVQVSYLATCIVFGVLQLAVAIFGYGSITWLSRLAFPIKIIGLPWILIALLNVGETGLGEIVAFNTGNANQWILFVVLANTVAVTWFSQVTDAADYCRYSSSRRSMWSATALAALIGAGISAAFGAFGAAWSGGESGNTFEIAGSAPVGVLTLWVILIVLVFENWTINVLNLYTGGLALNNLFPRLGRLGSTLIVGLVGIALASMPELANQFTGIISAAGLIFAPLAGVLTADYLLVKRGQIRTEELFKVNGAYWYTGGFNLNAVVWTALGAVLYLALPEHVLPALICMLVAGAGYALTHTLTVRDSSRIHATPRQ